MATKEMSTLIFNDQEYEIVDDTARSSIGTLSNLTTTEKGSIVGAINEVIEDFDADLATHTADISALNSGKVSKTGDTMTGHLRFQSDNITDGVTPSSNAWGSGISGRDSSGNAVLMQVQPVDYSDGGKYIYLSRSATIAGTSKTASLRIGIDSSGDEKVLVSDSSAWRSALGAVSKSGDTMNGSIAIKDTSLDATATHTSSYWGTGFQFNIVDKNGVDIGHIRPFCTSDDSQGIYLETPRTVNGSTVNNYLRLAVDGSGNRKVLLLADPWLEALGLTTAAYYSGWKTLTLNSAFQPYGSEPVQYRRVGNVVEVGGIIKPTAEITNGDSATIGTLPMGYRPNTSQRVLCQGSYKNSWLLTINTSGTIVFQRYGAGGEYVTATTSVWLPFNAMFITTSALP